MFDHRKYKPNKGIKKTDRKWPANSIEQAPAWCAVDLRDGNQALIEPMNVAQKQKLWTLLIDMGFKEIEVGFPSASQTDFDFVRWLIKENQIPQDVTIQVLVQARDELIERTFEALKGVKQAVVHVYNSTSPVQREKVFELDKQGIINIATRGAQKVLSESKRYPSTQWTFQYSPESFSSTETDFAIDVCNSVIDVWQPTSDKKIIINLPATVECAGPNVFADQVETFCEHIKQRENIIISIHTHNDRGCAVAAAELAILAGADRIEGTLLGNGERTGNMDIITMAMNLYSQGIDPKLNLSDAKRITRTVEECTNIPTHARHPWMGDLVYTAFSGSHQDAIKKCLALQDENSTWEVAYLPIDPKDIGRDYQSVIRVNSQSGKGGVAYILESEFNIQLPRWMQIQVSQKVQQESEGKGEVSANEIYQIFKVHFLSSNGPISLLDYDIQAKQDSQSKVMHLHLKDEHKTFTLHHQSEGAIDGLTKALGEYLNVSMDVTQYNESSLGFHSDANALASIEININNQTIYGCAIEKDSLKASLLAIMNATNTYLSKQTIAA
ncbi:2-isopropylmalate synthase [Oceaniserpentilla sp. 4NH20-0058]|uniref:2-isopropylmalate synthase n=1 Tax=Oceaniserpentilla sp. 4NH20-0058 TaxID=3127660 RepID=UPI003104673B